MSGIKITLIKTVRIMLMAIYIAINCWPAASVAQTALQDFRVTDFFWSQNPQLFQNLWQAARTGTIRIAIFGDSQETSPTSYGFQYIPRLNYEMWKRFG